MVALIRRDWRSFLLAVLGSGIAALIAIFQFAVFTSFIVTAYAVPRFLDGDVWVTGRNVSSFDFPYPIEVDYGAQIVSRFPEARFRRVLFRFAPWEDPNGNRGNVAIVGVDDIPLPRRSFFVDETELDSMNLRADDDQMVFLGDTAFWNFRPIRGLATFLGIPYIVTSVEDAQDILDFPADMASYIIIDTPLDGGELDQLVSTIRTDFPGVSILTDRQFNKRTATYWMAKTGAGAAISLAAILAAVIMVIFLVTGISRFCQRYYDDFMTLIGLGYDHRIVRQLTTLVASLLVAGAMIIAIALLPIIEALTVPVVPWVSTKPQDVLFGVILAMTASGIAWFSVSRQVTRIDLAEVFR